jgi:hypothetical protein
MAEKAKAITRYAKAKQRKGERTKPNRAKRKARVGQGKP